MTTTKSNLVPLFVMPGVQPSTDKTALATQHFTASDKIRFRNGFPQKIGGWIAVLFSYSATISGKARSIFSTILSTAINTIIGTNTSLFAMSGSSLTNITPLNTATVPIANSLKTDYRALSANPITTTSGSTVITITDGLGATQYQNGDVVTLSGLTAFNGLTIGNLNATFPIHSVGGGAYTVIVAAAANASSSGGGAGGNVATGFITVSATAHGMSNGYRVAIAGAADTGGILAATINSQFIIRSVATDFFSIMIAGTATSSVLAGGGAGTTYQSQIAAGAVNQSIAQGYGMGKYGVGLYGTALMSSSTLSYPRIWFFDRFGANIIMTAGNQTGLYSWAGSTATAPALVTNAPTAINYAFVSDNIIVTLGAGGTNNRIFSCDQGAMTNWTGSSTNQVFDYTVYGASQLKSQVAVNSLNLIFSDHQTYTFQYIGLPGVWSVNLLENNVGIIAPMARCAVGGTAYWMDVNNFYMWSGGNVQIIPSNSQEVSTLQNYVFSNINMGQASKCFAWYNEKFNEVWFHYPSASSNEPDRVARLYIPDMSWTPDTFDRLCAEYPNLTLGYPRLIDSSSVLYGHEQGNDANGAAMPWSLTSNLRTGASPKTTSLLSAIVPDSVQTGNVSVLVVTKNYPQSATQTYSQSYTITPTTDLMPIEIGGRFWQYTLSGNTLGQSFIAGQWSEYVQESSNQ